MKIASFLCLFCFVTLIVFAAWAPDKLAMARGKKLYTTYCLTCHQADGGGVPGLNPPLEKTSYVLGKKTALIQIVLKGMDQKADIDGESYSNTMPPHKFLTNQQIADVLTFVRNSFNNKAAAITAADVKYVRSKTR